MPVFILIEREKILPFFHNGSTTLEIWSNWSADTGEYSNPVTFDIITWGDSTTNTTLYSKNITLGPAESATLYFRNNIFRHSSLEENITIDSLNEQDDVKLYNVIHDDFDSVTINATTWSLQPTYTDYAGNTIKCDPENSCIYMYTPSGWFR